MSYWDKARSKAFRLRTAELARHAGISFNNRHKCYDCFCCACWAELDARMERGSVVNYKFPKWSNADVR